MKKLFRKLKENKEKIKNKLTTLGTTIGITLMLGTNKVLAASGTESIDSFINFACDWLTKIGGVVALVGRSYVCFRMAKRRCRRKIKRFNDFNGWFYASCYCSI